MVFSTHRKHVKIPGILRDPWFWVGIAGFVVMVVSIYAEDQGWVSLGGQLGADVGLLVALIGLLTSASRAQLGGVHTAVRGVGAEVREVRSELSGMRSELSAGLAAIIALLVEVRDRLPPGPR